MPLKRNTRKGSGPTSASKNFGFDKGQKGGKSLPVQKGRPSAKKASQRVNV